MATEDPAAAGPLPLANDGFKFSVPVHFYLAMPLFNREMKIFSGTAHKQLALKIAESVGVPLADATVTSFPDGESRVKINENIRGRDVFIVQPTCPPTNHNLMELLILIDAARRASAYRITAVIPYFGYARCQAGRQSPDRCRVRPCTDARPSCPADSRIFRYSG